MEMKSAESSRGSSRYKIDGEQREKVGTRANRWKADVFAKSNTATYRQFEQQ